MPSMIPDDDFTGWEKVASKLEWIQTRPDKFAQTEDGQRTLAALKSLVRHNERIDPLVPWLWREAKKGRLKSNGAGAFWTSDGTPLNLGHWADWFASGNQNPTRRGVDIMQLDVEGMRARIAEWDEHMRQQQELADEDQLRNGGEAVHELPNGWTVRKLRSEDLDAEGDAMGHCVGGFGYEDAVDSGRTLIYSLRDPNGGPHATVEMTPTRWLEDTKKLDWALTHNSAGRALPDDLKAVLHAYQNWMIDGRDAGEPVPTYPGANLPELYNALVARAPQYGTPLIENGKIVQIQGKGNEVPKREYQAMLKDWLTSIPEDQRPTWHHGAIDSIGALTGRDDDGDPWEDDAGGYGPHGDYGIRAPVDYHSVLDSLKSRVEAHGNRYGPEQVDHDDLEAVYQAALERGEIPHLAKAVDDWNERVAQPSYQDLEDMNFDYLGGYPGESYEEEPERWDAEASEWHDSGQEAFDAARAQYDANRLELYDSHGPSQIVGGLYNRLHHHWNNETNAYETPVAKPTTFSKVAAQPEPFRLLWAFSPQSGQVHVYDESEHHPADAPTHDSIAADLGEVGLHHGYAYTIPGGWRVLDYHHKTVTDPYVLRHVVEALAKRTPDTRLAASRRWWEPGQPGRGMVMTDGEVVTWPEDEGTHWQRAEAMNRDYTHAFMIRPTGEYYTHDVRWQGTPETHAAIQAADPRLRPTGTPEHIRGWWGRDLV